jgi:NAD(P)-dependent dehydrogenase (short-subunit alcohol dehydrogenase family)
MHGRVALITGGSRGLGLLLAREFAQRGCRIAICARDPGELERARLGLERRGHDVYASPCDVADPADVQRLISDVLERFGRLDILVNNASIMQVGPLDSMNIDDFHRAMDVNFWGTVHTSLAALDALRDQPGGRLVNICSIGSKVAMPHLLPYDCAKFAVLGFSEGMRTELAKDGISVTTVIPGLMRTGSFANAEFKGLDPATEFQWFSTMAQSHSTTLDGRDAARMIVDAAQHRKPEIILGWQARMLALAKAMVPSTLSHLLAAANRHLPRGRGTTNGLPGKRLALAANRDRWH